MKPKALVEQLLQRNYPIEVIAPKPLARTDFYRAHDKQFVDDVLDCKADNGFSNRSPSVAASLPFTAGALYDAALMAKPDMPCAALVSGFHHSGWNFNGGFCSLNGILASALRLMEEHNKKIAILDLDQHFGDGSFSILDKLNLHDKILHITFGKYFNNPTHAQKYLNALDDAKEAMRKFKPDILLCQLGADASKDDPYGGVLSVEQLFIRDHRVFSMCKELGISMCWDLAGGYQVPVQKVLDIHLNSFQACMKVYKIDNDNDDGSTKIYKRKPL
jgi:acetoin utilization deacetylase AcuC-like enzyme